MRLKVQIIGQRKNPDGVDFRFEDENGEIGVVLNCLRKITYGAMLGYYGALGEAKYGFSAGKPVNLNRCPDGTWELLIE